MVEHLGKDVRRIIRVGDSIGITLPPDYLRAHGLKVGDQIELTYNRIIRFEPISREEIRRKLGGKE